MKRSKITYLAFLVCVVFIKTIVLGQSVLDTDFDGDGKLELDYSGYSEVVQLEKLSDESILIIGNTTSTGSDYDFMLTKIDKYGDSVIEFGVGGTLIGDFPKFDYSKVSGALEMVDGTILLVGKGKTFAAPSINPAMFMKVSATGVIDTNFADSGVLQIDFLGDINVPGKLHLSGNNKILMACSSEDNVDGSGYVAVLARYNSDMTLDTTLAGTGKLEVDVTAGMKPINAKTQHATSGGFTDISTTSSGDIYAVGYTLNSYRFGFVVKLKENGDQDSTFYDEGIYAYFNADTLYNNNIIGINRLSDESFALIFDTDRADNNFTVGHIKNNAVTVKNFDVNGHQDFLEEVLETSDGELLLVGRTVFNDNFNSASYADQYAVIKLNSDWSRDWTYGTGGVVSLEWDGVNQAGANVAVLVDKDIIMAGEVYGPSLSYINLGVLKLTETGLTSLNSITDPSLIHTFPNPTSGMIKISSDLKILSVIATNQYGQSKKFSYDDQFNLTEFKSGIIFLQITTVQGIITHKIVKY